MNELVVSCSCGSVRLTRSYERTLFWDKRWGCSTKGTHRPECRDTPVQTLKLSTTCRCRFIQGHSFDKREWAILPRFEICSPPAWTGRYPIVGCLSNDHILVHKAVFALSHRWISLFLGDSVVNIIDVLIILKHRAVWRLWTNAGTALTLVVMPLSAAIRVVTPGNPRSFAQRRLQIPPTQKQDRLTKSY